MNNNLILRTLTSPYGDITRGTVLSQSDVDNNFIFLKGSLIYTATSENGVVTLTKNNGDTLSWLDAAGLSADTFWSSGSSGNYSIKRINDSTIDATGNYSYAEGLNTIASGDASHAEGDQTTASGDTSHAEGYVTISSGIGSHAEGSGSYASGYGSHAEGADTQSIGYVSHAEGYGTIASGEASHAEGAGTIASGDNAHAEGHNTTASGAFTHSEGAETLASGDFAHAEGIQTTASGIASHSEGYRSLASGEGSHAEGGADSDGLTGGTASGLSSHAEGGQTTASGYVSHAEGYGTIASGVGAHAEGENTIASGNQSHAEGASTTASGGTSHAEGGGTKALGSLSHAEGDSTIASGYASHTEGVQTTASDEGSHAEGNLTTASGRRSHAEGYLTTASGESSHAEGFSTFAENTYSHAEGNTTLASGLSSHAEGVQTTASGDYSHAQGYLTTAIGQESHAEGYLTTASGIGSHAEGNLTTAIGSQSHAGGTNSIASGVTSFVHGNTSVAIGNATVVLGNNLTGTTANTTYVNAFNIKSLSTGTSVNNLGIDVNGNIIVGSTGSSSTNLGRILYVSVSGNNSTAVAGDINKPWSSLYSARTASVSGDTIHVFPQTFTFDNRAATGMQWNNRQDEINIWKNGVNWYFEKGCTIKLYNQTISGQTIYLMKPQTDVFSTCNVYGYLNFETYSEGVNTNFGDSYLYYNGTGSVSWGGPSYEAVGNSCYLEVDTLTSYCNELVSINRDVVISDKTITSSVTLVVNKLVRNYVQGQTGGGAGEVYLVSSDASLIYSSYIKERTHNGNWMFYLRGTSLTGTTTSNSTTVTVNGDRAYGNGTSTNFIRVNSNFSSTFNYNIDNSYFGTSNTGGFVITESAVGGVSFPWSVNIKGNINDNHPTSSAQFFNITSSGNTLSMDGNITTNKTSGVGRPIVVTTANSLINFNGDIAYKGSGATTSIIFKSGGFSTINYNGNILGSFACPITNCLTGSININNSFIKSSITGASSTIIANGSTTLGTVRINNSYVEMGNNTNALANGSYVNALINNSVIVNIGSSNTLENTTAFGRLQLLNTTVMSSGSSINYTNSASTVVSSNSQVNTAPIITTLYGNIDTITEITY